MMKLDVRANREFYLPRLQEFTGHQAVGWGSRESQERRFAALVRICSDWSGISILDVGCGTGDLLAYMRLKSIYANYTGLDALPDSIKVCTERFPGIKFASVPVTEFTTPQPPAHYDYVVASGVFNLKGPNYHQVMLDSVEAMWRLATRGIAINFLTDQASDMSNYICEFVSPTERLQELQELTKTRRWAMYQDYLPNDFTIHLFKPDAEWPPLR